MAEATPLSPPLQHLRHALELAVKDWQQGSQQLLSGQVNSLWGLALANISGGVQALPIRKPDALVSVAAFLARAGAFLSQPGAPGGTKGQPDAAAGDGRVVCLEFTKGKRRVYRRKAAAEGAGFEAIDDEVTNRARVRNVFQDYLLPQGYPDSVAPQYGPYMFWRGVQYFFGGAMSVFTTRSLLAALGMQKHSGSAAAAINWVLKDGAGRLGRFLFARWGRQLDCELKQFRLAGDVLMETGAALELATVLVPQAFLALACTANLAKNLAAVAASATRAPIYRTFARQNNLADITAKGESVANLADVVGTAFGIALAKFNLPVVPTFALLSVGYLISSRKEVDSVVLPYLNRARLSLACRGFLDDGEVPGLEEANTREPLVPWADPIGQRVVLGARVADACADPAALEAALAAFPGRQYAITYRPDTRKAYVLLKEGVSCQQLLEATFDAQVLLFMLNKSQKQAAAKQAPAVAAAAPPNGKGGASGKGPKHSGAPGSRRGSAARPLVQLDKAAAELDPTAPGWHDQALRYVARSGPELYRRFERQAVEQGWRMNLTMLNASETRLRMV